MRKAGLEAIVLAYLLSRGKQGATLEELERLVEAAAAAGLLAHTGRDPRQDLINYLAFLKRNRTIEVEGDRIILVDRRISPILRRVLHRVQESILQVLTARLQAPVAHLDTRVSRFRGPLPQPWRKGTEQG